MAKKKRQGGDSPAKQMDFLKKGFDLYMEPYKKGYKYLKDNVTKIKGYMDGDNELKKMEPRGAKPITQPKKPNDAIIYDMKHQYDIEKLNKNRGNGGETKQETERKLKAEPPKPVKQEIENKRDSNMIKQVNRMNDTNYDLIEGDKNQNMNVDNVDGDVGQQKGYGGG